jgi:hypothetical protein
MHVAKRTGEWDWKQLGIFTDKETAPFIKTTILRFAAHDYPCMMMSESSSTKSSSPSLNSSIE